MNIWPFWKGKEETRADTENSIDTNTTSNALLKALLDEDVISKKEALEIPAIQSCINHIAGTISSIPFKLYQIQGGKVMERKEDERLFLLNNDTGDTLTATQFWKAMIEDYFLGKGGYAYINSDGCKVYSLHYVNEEEICIQHGTDPIFKDYNILVRGRRYFPHQFFKILRKTKDGADSRSLMEENNLLLSVMWNTLRFENGLVKKGGNKRGFLKSAKKLTEQAMDVLKAAFKKLYSSEDENVVVLNDGIDFKESSNTSVEMQMNENKTTNMDDACRVFCMPPSVMKGNATEEDNKKYIRECIVPILCDIESSLDRDLLLECEKRSFYFAADTRELTRGNIKERYEAYQIALQSNFMQIDEVREQEDLEALGFKWITLGLNQVLYNPETNEIYTPNTNKTQDMKNLTVGSTEERAEKNILITGAPGSGKTTWVQKQKHDDEIMVDLDLLKCALYGNNDLHAEAKELVPMLTALRDAAYKTIADGKVSKRCFVITTETDKETLREWSMLLDAKLHIMDTPKEVCVERVKNDDTRPDKQTFYGLIDKWFSEMEGGEKV